MWLTYIILLKGHIQEFEYAIRSMGDSSLKCVLMISSDFKQNEIDIWYWGFL